MLNQGTFHVPSGTVAVNAGLESTNHTGHWTIASGATLYFNGSSYHLTGGDITAAGTGKLRTDANLTLESGVPLNVEDLLVSAATLTLNGTAALPADYDKVEFTNGIRAGDRNWTIKNLTIDSADFRGPHTTTVTTSFKKTGGGTLSLRFGGPDLIVNAPATHDGGQICIDDQTNTGPGSDPLLEINGTWTMSNTASFACTGGLDAPGLKISPTGTLNAANTIGTPMLNQGTFHVPAGTVFVQCRARKHQPHRPLDDRQRRHPLLQQLQLPPDRRRHHRHRHRQAAHRRRPHPRDRRSAERRGPAGQRRHADPERHSGAARRLRQSRIHKRHPRRRPQLDDQEPDDRQRRLPRPPRRRPSPPPSKRPAAAPSRCASAAPT